MSNYTITVPSETIERLFCPLCEETTMRLRRLGVINEKDTVLDSGISKLVSVIGVPFYEMLFDRLDMEDTISVLDNLFVLIDAGDSRAAYLYSCFAYGMAFQEPPDAFLWISASTEALSCYFRKLKQKLFDYMREDELIGADSEST